MARTIFVTGGTGFVAGRFIEVALRDSATRVRALVRDPRRAERLLRWSSDRVEIVRGDLLDGQAVLGAVAGATHVLHAAYGTDGTDEEQYRATVEGARNVLDAAREHGPRRVIILSSLAVYDWGTGSRIDESSPLAVSGDAYARSKIEVERLAREAFDRYQTPTVVLQPSLVWGPGSETWTTSFLDALDEGPVPLVDGGARACPLVYVDDVVDAVLRAFEAPGIEGERFLISSGERTTWRDLLQGYRALLGRGELVDVASEQLRRDAGIVRRVRSLVSALPRTLAAVQNDSDLRRAVRRLPIVDALLRLAPGARRVLSLARRRPVARSAAAVPPGECPQIATTGPLPAIHPDRLRLYAADLEVDAARARRVLGFEPRYCLERGLDRVRAWAEHQGRTAPLF